MKGDFSNWDEQPDCNYQGVLHQQGRVLLDQDWNAQTQITGQWQDLAGQDLFGAGTASVPADQHDHFRVEGAVTAVVAPGDPARQVILSITPGRLWADGHLVTLHAGAGGPDAAIHRVATYLPPPVGNAEVDESSIGADIRDAVILEVWRESLNGFQDPETLIEPALGGPDTTERVLTSMAFRLLRLDPTDTCSSIRSRLHADFLNKGRLAVTLQPTTIVDGECPVAEGGGYSGFEHQLYRVEIAIQENRAITMFKWSQFNGGLVGRGTFADNRVTIDANQQAIVHSGLHEFYLEAEEYDPDLGHWRVTFGAVATLNADLELELEDVSHFGQVPEGDHSIFFRLWNGIRRISDFPAGAEPVELQDGIRLEFDAATAGSYAAGDYWTFSVRAGGIHNHEILINHQPPAGIQYHRVPLAILNWNRQQEISAADHQISDCRGIFRSLTDQRGCCTFLVGDGQRSHGDFNSIADALEHLPERGGKICLLPGWHFANVRITGKHYIQITGCGTQSIVYPEREHVADPIFLIDTSQDIEISHLTLVAFGGTAIVVDDPMAATQSSRGIKISHNQIIARIHAIDIKKNDAYAEISNVTIDHNLVSMADLPDGKSAISLEANNALILQNRFVVTPRQDSQDPTDPRNPEEGPDAALDPCVERSAAAGNLQALDRFRGRALLYASQVQAPGHIEYTAQGGIQIGSGSERIRIHENEIIGGSGNGITLGSDLTEVDTASSGFDLVDETPAVQFQTEERTIQGEVHSEEGPVTGATFVIEDDNGGTSVVQTDDRGYFIAETTSSQGSYKPYSVSPGYRVTAVIPERMANGQNYYHLEVRPIGPGQDPAAALAPIYVISIRDNLILNMGLCGIGSSLFSGTEDRLLLMKVQDLEIRQNAIRKCCQQLPDLRLWKTVHEISFAGISLIDCEHASIIDNHIENNGIDLYSPLSGLFIYHAEKVEISRNCILNNGQRTAANDHNLIQGLRGGIVIRMSFRELVNEWLDQETTLLPDGIPAAKIHDNIVTQPLGQALILYAFGPVSICGNHLTSQGTDYRMNPLSTMVGAVLVFNLGLSKDLIRWALAASFRNLPTERTGGQTEFANSTDSLSSDLTQTVGEQAASSFDLVDILEKIIYLPSGYVLFADNQVSLDLRAREISFSACSQLIVSLDDISYSGNQSECTSLVDAVLANVFVAAPTIRVNNNRFQEGFTAAMNSLFSYGFVNMATANQATHCLQVLGNYEYLVDSNNMVLLPANCKQMKDNIVDFFAIPQYLSAD